MITKRIRTTTWCCGVIAGLAAACASPPRLNPALELARSEYNAAKADTVVVNLAPVALKKAEETLNQGDQLWQQRADKKQVTHRAYLAQQQTRIARETARLKAAEAAIDGAGLKRQEVQLKVLNREAEQATLEAAAAKDQTRTATLQAQEARNQTQIATVQAEAARNQARTANLQAQDARNQAQAASEEATAHIEKLTKQLSELEAKQTERGLVLTLKDVLFGVGKADLKPGAQRVVDQLAGFLGDYPERGLLIEGHTDSDGSQTYNQDLSLRRAEAVRQALVSRGVAFRRIEVRGYGETYPVTTSTTAEGRQQNRRVEVVFSDDQGKVIER